MKDVIAKDPKALFDLTGMSDDDKIKGVMDMIEKVSSSGATTS